VAAVGSIAAVDVVVVAVAAVVVVEASPCRHSLLRVYIHAWGKVFLYNAQIHFKKM
jgi:hypothetical protein